MIIVEFSFKKHIYKFLNFGNLIHFFFFLILLFDIIFIYRKENAFKIK